MLITVLGSVGMGLFWGWLLTLFGGRAPLKRPLITGLALILASSLVGLQLFLFAGLTATIYFVVAAVLASLVHQGWCQTMRNNRLP